MGDTKEIKFGTGECPLCQISSCQNCPISKKTGESLCDGTPYTGYEQTQDEEDFTKEFMVEFLKKELNFLISLLLEVENVNEERG